MKKKLMDLLKNTTIHSCLNTNGKTMGAVFINLWEHLKKRSNGIKNKKHYGAFLTATLFMLSQDKGFAAYRLVDTQPGTVTLQSTWTDSCTITSVKFGSNDTSFHLDFIAQKNGNSVHKWICLVNENPIYRYDWVSLNDTTISWTGSASFISSSDSYANLLPFSSPYNLNTVSTITWSSDLMKALRLPYNEFNKLPLNDNIRNWWTLVPQLYKPLSSLPTLSSSPTWKGLNSTNLQIVTNPDNVKKIGFQSNSQNDWIKVKKNSSGAPVALISGTNANTEITNIKITGDDIVDYTDETDVNAWAGPFWQKLRITEDVYTQKTSIQGVLRKVYADYLTQPIIWYGKGATFNITDTGTNPLLTLSDSITLDPNTPFSLNGNLPSGVSFFGSGSITVNNNTPVGTYRIPLNIKVILGPNSNTTDDTTFTFSVVESAKPTITAVTGLANAPTLSGSCVPNASVQLTFVGGGAPVILNATTSGTTWSYTMNGTGTEAMIAGNMYTFTATQTVNNETSAETAPFLYSYAKDGISPSAAAVATSMGANDVATSMTASAVADVTGFANKVANAIINSDTASSELITKLRTDTNFKGEKGDTPDVSTVATSIFTSYQIQLISALVTPLINALATDPAQRFKGPKGDNGTNGQDGTNGPKGADGISPSPDAVATALASNADDLNTLISGLAKNTMFQSSLKTIVQNSASEIIVYTALYQAVLSANTGVTEAKAQAAFQAGVAAAGTTGATLSSIRTAIQSKLN